MHSRHSWIANIRRVLEVSRSIRLWELQQWRVLDLRQWETTGWQQMLHQMIVITLIDFYHYFLGYSFELCKNYEIPQIFGYVFFMKIWTFICREYRSWKPIKIMICCGLLSSICQAFRDFQESWFFIRASKRLGRLLRAYPHVGRPELNNSYFN